MDTELLKELLKALSGLRNAGTYTSRVPISAFPFSRPEGFWISVGTEGDITYVDWDGNSHTSNFATGYHPTKFKTITSATATGLVAHFNS